MTHEEDPSEARAMPGTVATSWFDALWRGFRHRCPRCDHAGILEGFLRIRPRCVGCGLELGEFRADDAPPYFTIFIVGHLIVPAVLLVERLWAPALWLQALIWIPATLALTLALLPRVKGAVIGWHWAAGIKG
jgi:uncharacterized protein (DUF983 family)